MRGVCLFWGAVAAGVLLVASGATARPTASGWTRAGLGAVSQPAAVSDRLVLYAQRGGALRVLALRARDGSTAWVAVAAPSEVTAGVPAMLAVRGGVVFFFQPLAGQVEAARLVGRDVASGRTVWSSLPGVFTSWPEICPDMPTAVCVTGLLPSGGSGERRFDAATGRQLGSVKMGPGGAGSRELAPGLFDPGTRNPDQLVATSAGRIVWRRPLSEIFTLPRASSDGGWNLDRLSGPGLFVGSVGTTPRIVGGKTVVDLGNMMTAGFRIGSGRVVFRSRGYYACNQLPCVGAAEAGYSSPLGLHPAGPSVGLREVFTGRVSFPLAGGQPRISADASVTIQGFDETTGKTRWAFAAGRNTALLSDELTLPRLAVDTIALRARTGRLVALNLRSGVTHAIRSTARGWCRKTINYRLASTGYYRGGGGQYTGQNAVFPCDGTGVRVATPARAPAVVARIGAATAGIVAWTDVNAVHAARRG